MTAVAHRSDLRTSLTVVGGCLVAFATSTWARAQRIEPIATYVSGIAVEWPKQAVLTLQEMVADLREGGMPVSAIAEMVGVERKTVYSWLDGTLAKTDRVHRVEELHSILEASDLPLGGLWKVWGRSLGGGTSLRELLTSKTLDRIAILEACSELRPVVERQAGRVALRGVTNVGAGNPVVDDMAVADLG